MTLFHRLRRLIRRAGIDVSRYPKHYRPNDVVKLMRHHAVDTVLDIGASTGQYAREIRELGYTGRIIACEPLSYAYAELYRAAAADPQWQALRTAVGAEPGHATINVAANRVSSSLVAMFDRHLEAAPKSRYIGMEEVPVTTIEALCVDLPGSRIFAKVDTQGYERQVLAGADLEQICGFQLELSLVPLYEGGMALGRC